MTYFSYTALKQDGKEIKGTLEAPDEKEAVSLLRRQAFFVVEIKPVNAKRKNTSLGRWRTSIKLSRYLRVSNNDKALYFRQMSLMLRSGYTILQALGIARSLVTKTKFIRTLDAMQHDIESGMPLSQAMAEHPKIFTPLMINLIASGEVSGQLDMIHDKLAQNLEHSNEIKRQLITALIYPSIIVVASIGVATFMLIFVVPKFTAFFAARQIDIPFLLTVLIATSDFLIDNAIPILTILLGTIFGLLVSYTTPKGKAILDRSFLSIPLIGKAIIYSSMARFGTTMSMLISSGLTVKDALNIMSKVFSNHTLSTRMLRAEDAVLSGQNLSKSLEGPAIPPLVCHMTAVGEKSGSLDEVMHETGSFYGQLLSSSISRMVALLEPMLFLVIGGMVAFIYVALFQAIFKVSTGGL